MLMLVMLMLVMMMLLKVSCVGFKQSALLFLFLLPAGSYWLTAVDLYYMKFSLL